MLAIRYGDDVPRAIADMLEFHARAAGLSLGALEVLGASLSEAEAFIVAAEEGRGVDHARARGLTPPEDPLARARWVAHRIFGPA